MESRDVDITRTLFATCAGLRLGAVLQQQQPAVGGGRGGAGAADAQRAGGRDRPARGVPGEPGSQDAGPAGGEGQPLCLRACPAA